MNVCALQSSPAEKLLLLCAGGCFKETSVEGGRPVRLNWGDERVRGDVQRDETISIEVEILWMPWLE